MQIGSHLRYVINRWLRTSKNSQFHSQAQLSEHDSTSTNLSQRTDKLSKHSSSSDHLIDPIIVNNFMDLSVRFQMADRAIELYQILQSRQEKDQRLQTADIQRNCASNQTENNEKHICYSHNASIQVGILIKAYG